MGRLDHHLPLQRPGRFRAGEEVTTALLWIACLALVAAGSAVQAAVGAGLSVTCGFFVILWLGAAAGVPTLLCLNVIGSVMATLWARARVRWDDVMLASGATLAGCVAASALPSLPETWLRAMTAGMLVIIALPRPPVPGALPSPGSARAGIAAAGLVTGLLTVWTATPGPITPVSMARAGRSGAEIRLMMQPISAIGYGAALAWGGLPPVRSIGGAIFGTLIAATLAGTAIGLHLRPRIDPARVVLLIRLTAGLAALVLVASLLSGG